MNDSGRQNEVPLVSEHDTWISVDPIIGCPANCRYCYLGPLSLRGKQPVIRLSAADLVAEVEDYLNERARTDPYNLLVRTPICFGNYTDTFMSETSLAYFHEYARLHAAKFSSHPLCVVTKASVTYEDLRRLDQLGHTIIVFMSQSFLGQLGTPHIERGPTCKPAETLGNIRRFADMRNVKPVHFLRPVTGRSVPSLSRALEILSEVQSAGSLATVAVGLKIGPGIKLSDDELTDLLGEGQTADRASNEIFPAAARQHLLEAARTLQYPVYFHTSCAVALATEADEDLGTWREPMREARCAPCSCPGAQRSRCDAVRSQQSVPSPQELSDLCVSYHLPAGSARWLSQESAVKLDHRVRQYTFNRLVHALPYKIIGGTVEPDEAWLGPFTKGNKLSVRTDQDIQDGLPGLESSLFGPQMFAAVGRLNAITGFVTTLHKPSDPRALAFARYYHVRRVAWVSEWLRSGWADRGEQLDASNVHWLAWAHDLNRWPFAHNSEKGLFDQAGDVSRYVITARLGFPASCSRDAEGKARLVADLEGVISKDRGKMSPEGRLVLLADIIAGFIEDPLLAVTGLDLSPRLIPDIFREALALPLNDGDFVSELKALNLLLYEGRDVSNFMSSFDVIFRRGIQSFADKYQLAECDPLEESWFEQLRSSLKESFLRKVLFPYNNEKVAHGSLIKEELVGPLLKKLGHARAAAMFTEIDEPGFLDLAEQHGIIDAGSRERERYFPDIDYMQTFEPENSFRRSR